MSEFKGTTGEWILGDEKYYNGNKAFEVWYGKDGECVAEVVHKIEDAKLIACAPEMLNMLIRISEHECFSGSKEIETLIKKATE